MDNIFLVAATCYALLFWAIGWRAPGVALALIFGAAPFANDLAGGIAGVKFSLAEVHLVLTLPILVLTLLQGERPLQFWPFLWPCALYFAVCIASGFVEWRGNAALTSAFQMVLFMFVLIPVFSVLARRPEDLLPALWALLGISVIIALNLIATRSNYVLGLHKNGVGGSLGCAFLVAFELWFHFRDRAGWPKFVALTSLAIIAVGLLLSLSRGGWMGTLLGVFLIAAMRRQFALMGRIALLLIPLMALGWQMLPEESRSYATSFDASRGNISQRYLNQDFAMQAFQGNPLLGGGLGIRKQYDATQIVLFTLAETGILGLLSLTGVFVAFFAMIWKTQQRLGRDDMAFSVLAIGGALMLARVGQGMVDHYWARGPTMMGWAAAGMAVGVFLYAPQGSHSHRLGRARALLALHLLEMRRRGQGTKGQIGLQSAPPMSKAELERAREALALVQAQNPRAKTRAALDSRRR